MIGVLAVAAGVIMACLPSLLLLQGVLKTLPADLPRPLRGLVRILVPNVEWSGQPGIPVAALPAVVMLGCLVLFGLSVPVMFLLDPEWRSSENSPGTPLALLGLAAYGAWLAYLARSYWRAARRGMSRAKPPGED